MFFGCGKVLCKAEVIVIVSCDVSELHNSFPCIAAASEVAQTQHRHRREMLLVKWLLAGQIAQTEHFSFTKVCWKSTLAIHTASSYPEHRQSCCAHGV